MSNQDVSPPSNNKSQPPADVHARGVTRRRAVRAKANRVARTDAKQASGPSTDQGSKTEERKTSTQDQKDGSGNSNPAVTRMAQQIAADDKKCDFRRRLPDYNDEQVSGLPFLLRFPRRNKLKFHFEKPPNLSSNDCKSLEEWWDLDSSKIGPEIGHPYAAITRDIAETYVHQLIIEEAATLDIHGGCVVDIGGNGKRNYKYNRKWLHSCQPEYSSQEVKFNGCTNKFADCLVTCFGTTNEKVALCEIPTCTMSTHAWYYLTDEEKVLAVSNNIMKCSYIVVHDFPRDVNEGKLCHGQVYWRRLDDGLINCRAEGNNTVYQHKDLPLLDGQETLLGVTLKYEPICSFSDQKIYRVSIGQHSNVVEFKKNDIVERVRKLAKVYLMGTDRSKSTVLRVYLQKFTAKLKEDGLWKEFQTVPDHYDVLISMFYETTEDENKTMADNIKPIVVESNDSNRKLSLLELPDFPVAKYIFGFIVSAMIIMRFYKTKKGSQKNGILFIPMVITGLSFWRQCKKKGYTLYYLIKYRKCITLFSIMRRAVDHRETYVKFWEEKQKQGVPNKLEDYRDAIVCKIPDVCAPEPLEPCHPDAEYKFPPHVDCQPTRIVQCVGYGLSNYLPSYPRPCSHMMEAAFRNRVMLVDVGEPDAWEFESPAFTRAFEVYNSKLMFHAKANLEDWYQDIDPSKAKKIRDSIDKTIMLLRRHEDPNIREAFGKFEPFLGKDKFSTRVIQMVTDEYQTIVGPETRAIGEFLASYFSPTKFGQISYATKCSAEECANWFGYWPRDKYTWFVLDGSRFDARLNQYALAYETRQYANAMFTSNALKIIESHQTTRLKYFDKLKRKWSLSVPGKRGSGTNNTATGNLIINVSATERQLNRIFNCTTGDTYKGHYPWVGQFNGDDGSIGVLTELLEDKFGATEEFVYQLVSGLRTMSIVSKAHEVDDTELEFCSRLIVPVDDEGYCLTPKIGRVLAKTYWDRKNLPIDEAVKWCGEVALGLHLDVNHVPLLRVLNRRVMEDYWATKPIEEDWAFEKIHAERLHMITDRTWDFYTRRYGYTKDEFLAVEEKLSLPEYAPPHILDHPMLRAIAVKDLGGVEYCNNGNIVEYPVHILKRGRDPYLPIMDYWFPLTGAPILEETVKRFVRYFLGNAGLGGLCGAMAVIELPEDATLYAYLNRMLLHYGLGCMPWWLGVISHGLFNFIIDWTNRRRPRGIRVSKLNVFMPRRKNKTNKNKNSQQQKRPRRRRRRGNAPPNLEQQVNQIVRSKLSNLGASVGSLLGPVGGKVGSFIGSGIAKAAGFGDYKISRNTLLERQVPKFGTTYSGMRVQFREYLGNLYSSTTINTEFFYLNPRNLRTHPWFNPAGQLFNKFRYHGAIAAFISSSADALNSTNTALGKVIGSVQMDVMEGPFETEQQMLAADMSVVGKPSENLLLPIECDPKLMINDKFICTEYGASITDDLRWYYPAIFQFSAIGMQASSVLLGSIWLTYDLELLTPRIDDSPGGGDYAVYSASSYTNTNSLGPSSSGLTGNVYATVATNGLLTLSDATGECYTAMIMVTWLGTSAAVTLAYPTLSSNVIASTDWTAAGTNPGFSPGSGATTTKVQFIGVYDVDFTTSATATLTFSGLTLPTSGSALNVTIVKLPDSPTSPD